MLDSIDTRHTPITEGERLWKIKDVMEYLGCKEVTVWRYMHRYGLPYIKVSRTSPVLYRREKVKEWIASQEIVKPVHSMN